jgi:hypothetical protein
MSFELMSALRARLYKPGMSEANTANSKLKTRNSKLQKPTLG